MASTAIGCEWIDAWANGVTRGWPTGTGSRVDSGNIEWMVMDTHFYNPSHHTNAIVSDALKLTITKQLREHKVAIGFFGPVDFRLQPNDKKAYAGSRLPSSRLNRVFSTAVKEGSANGAAWARKVLPAVASSESAQITGRTLRHRGAPVEPHKCYTTAGPDPRCVDKHNDYDIDDDGWCWDGNKNLHCPVKKAGGCAPAHDPSKCMEHGNMDDDCCVVGNTGACADGSVGRAVQFVIKLYAFGHSMFRAICPTLANGYTYVPIEGEGCGIPGAAHAHLVTSCCIGPTAAPLESSSMGVISHDLGHPHPSPGKDAAIVPIIVGVSVGSAVTLAVAGVVYVLCFRKPPAVQQLKSPAGQFKS
eukprot:gene58044-biopygen105297